MVRIAWRAVALLAIGVCAAGRVEALPQSEPRGVAQQVMVASGEVSDIDRAGRMVTIKTGTTIQAPIYAGPDMPIFDQLNLGDRVTIRYYDAFIVALTPGARMSTPTDTTAEARQRFDSADRGVLQQITIVVTIDSVDEATGMVTYHGVDNRRVQRLVQQRSLIQGLAAGDVVTVSQTRAQAVTIERTP